MIVDEKIKINKTFLLGFGFFGISMIWALYNAYIPIFLKDRFNLSSSIVGFIMTIDNVFAVVLLPFLGALSDKTITIIGRRRPYILIGAPLAMIFFILIPFVIVYNLLFVMLIIVFLNLSMALFRSPVIALMPDITPSKDRSLANGIINFMGGLGALLVYFGGKPLYDKNISYPFIAGGIIMFIACFLVIIFINEDKSIRFNNSNNNSDKISIKKSFIELKENILDILQGEKSLLFVLLSIFCWFVGFNALETFFTSYAKFYLGFKESTGALILGFYSVSFMMFAIFSGFIGKNIGRKKTILIGLFFLSILILITIFFKRFLPLAIIFSLCGIAWSFINVNSLPMVVDMTGLEKVGGYTGLYYFFSQLANIVAPPLAGIIIDISTKNHLKTAGYISLIIFSSGLFILSFIIMCFVKRGEAILHRN